MPLSNVALRLRIDSISNNTTSLSVLSGLSHWCLCLSKLFELFCI